MSYFKIFDLNEIEDWNILIKSIKYLNISTTNTIIKFDNCYCNLIFSSYIIEFYIYYFEVFPKNKNCSRKVLEKIKNDLNYFTKIVIDNPQIETIDFWIKMKEEGFIDIIRSYKEFDQELKIQKILEYKEYVKTLKENENNIINELEYQLKYLKYNSQTEKDIKYIKEFFK